MIAVVISGDFRFLFQKMNKAMPTVKVPVPSYQCNLTVFPAPTCYKDKSLFYVLGNSEDFLTDQIGTMEIEYIPGMIYCFLPSMEKRQGSVSVYTAKPNFIDSFCMFFMLIQNI